MGRIRILSDTVANKIAAGEVVERPASVVKELLENSLDAGASSVRIEIESGGRKLIRITDDGYGMLADDAMLAFERHATSKLSEVKDLDSIGTLGFRGEALPSIAAVSRLTLETRSKEESTGARVEIAGGRMLKCEEAALASGTVVTVRDLFFNVPARKKFLRTEQTELAHIATLATHYSLAHPDKTFQLLHGASELLHVTPVAELRDRVYQVFGGQTLGELVDLGIRERDLQIAGSEGVETVSFFLRGFVSRPQVQKLNRNSIFAFVNGRLIKDRMLLHALSAAYHNLMPPSCYPFALLFLDCDAGEVDVNVHPSKTEVRFRHGSFVHDFVRDSIRAVLMESRPAPVFPLPAHAQPAASLPYSEFTQRIENQDFGPLPPAVPPDDEELPEVAIERRPANPRRSDFSAEPPGIPPAATREDRPPDNRPISSAPVGGPLPDSHGPLAQGVLLDEQQNLTVLRDLRPLGQIHDSFIIAVGRDGLWIIDQHVAHERILFERILRERAMGRVEMQQLLLPIVIEVTAGQQIEYARIADELNSMGFETEPFGNRTVAIKAAPAGVGTAEIEKILYEVLETSEREFRRASLDDLRRGIAASIACRAAIKINTRLDQNKMEWLLDALAGTEYPMSCPHGRPIALKYSMRDILKGFHRI